MTKQLPPKTTYAGIGSRKTPREILRVIGHFAQEIGQDTILRTGGAPGADQHFEFWQIMGMGEVELYIPWEGFQGYDWGMLPIPAAFEVAEWYHPNWHALKPGAQRLHARNSHQILGRTLDQPVSFAVCWTPDGAKTLDTITRRTGGTGQALRIAADYGIPIKNLANADDLAEIREIAGL